MASSPQKKDTLLVEKASGAREPFSEQKLERSLRMAGASSKLVERVMDRVRQQVYPEMTSRKLHQIAFQLLKKELCLYLMFQKSQLYVVF